MYVDAGGGDAGLRVLVVEDELVVAMELEALLTGLGHTVLGPVPTVERALALLARERPDLALLDVNLNGQWVTPVAEALRAHGVPFVLVTGYGGKQLRETGLRDARRLGKPVDGRRLGRLLAEVSGRPGRA